MTTATFAIGGMHCAACAVRNERTLRKIWRSRCQCKPRHTARTYRVRRGRGLRGVLRDAIVGNGYEVLSDDAGDSRQQARDELQRAKLRALWAILLALPSCC